MNNKAPGMSLALGGGGLNTELQQRQVLSPKLSKTITVRHDALARLKRRKASQSNKRS